MMNPYPCEINCQASVLHVCKDGAGHIRPVRASCWINQALSSLPGWGGSGWSCSGCRRPALPDLGGMDRHAEMKRRAEIGIVLSPKPPLVGFDDRMTDRQAESQPLAFGTSE